MDPLAVVSAAVQAGDGVVGQGSPVDRPGWLPGWFPAWGVDLVASLLVVVLAWVAARLAVLTVPTTLPGREFLVVALCTVFLLKLLPSINQLPSLDLLLRLVEIPLDVGEVVRRERERVIVRDVLQSTNAEPWIVLLVGVPSSIDGRTVDQSLVFLAVRLNHHVGLLLHQGVNVVVVLVTDVHSSEAPTLGTPSCTGWSWRPATRSTSAGGTCGRRSKTGSHRAEAWIRPRAATR